jgi:spermidine synthase
MYYVRQSGVGLALEHQRTRGRGTSPLRIGVVGLGAGTLACYAQSGDYLRFYEIDPLVVRLSQEHFTFQRDARVRGADVDIFLGDARLVMERQLARGDAKQFDVLVVDAFSSDAIPVHLLTKECFDVYLAHLKPSGILAIHISNRHLDLGPVVRTLAENAGQQALLVRTKLQRELLRYGSDVATGSEWVLVTSDEQALAGRALRSASKPWPESTRSATWTDDYSSLFTLLGRG